MPLINGAHAHNDAEIVFLLREGRGEHRVKTCQTADYSNNFEGAQVGGNQAGPVANAGGSADPTWSLECAKLDVDELITKMGDNYETQEFDMLVSYREVGTLARVTDYIDGCGGLGVSANMSRGSAVMTPIGSKALKVRFKGIEPFDKAP